MLPSHNSSPQRVGLNWRRERFCHLIKVPLIRFEFWVLIHFYASLETGTASLDGDRWVLQRLPKELLQHLWRNAASKPLQLLWLKRCSSSSLLSGKNTSLGTTWQKHAIVSPCPQRTWNLSGAAYWLGAGSLRVPEKRYTEDCPLSLLLPGAQGPSRPRIVLYSCGGSFIAKGVCGHQRSKNLLVLLQNWKKSWLVAFFQDLYQSACASKQTLQNLIGQWGGSLVWAAQLWLDGLDGLTHCLWLGCWLIWRGLVRDGSSQSVVGQPGLLPLRCEGSKDQQERTNKATV